MVLHLYVHCMLPNSIRDPKDLNIYHSCPVFCEVSCNFVLVWSNPLFSPSTAYLSLVFDLFEPIFCYTLPPSLVQNNPRRDYYWDCRFRLAWIDWLTFCVCVQIPWRWHPLPLYIVHGKNLRCKYTIWYINAFASFSLSMGVYIFCFYCELPLCDLICDYS